MGFALFAPSGKSGKKVIIMGFALFAPSGKSGKSMNHGCEGPPLNYDFLGMTA